MSKVIQDHESRVEKSVAERLASHEITTLRSDGLYRHYLCAKPRTVIDSFSIVTWPGYLCYCGDMGDYVFRRAEDMIGFMSGACRSYGYAAEKCVALGREGIWEFSHALFEERMAEEKVERPEYASKIDEILSDAKSTGIDVEHDAQMAMWDSGLFDELPDCRIYTFHFLFCLKAIDWFCKRLERSDK